MSQLRDWFIEAMAGADDDALRADLVIAAISAHLPTVIRFGAGERITNPQLAAALVASGAPVYVFERAVLCADE
jgi:hypothetical protein